MSGPSCGYGNGEDPCPTPYRPESHYRRVQGLVALFDLGVLRGRLHYRSRS
jgi:hypothetical protein